MPYFCARNIFRDYHEAFQVHNTTHGLILSLLSVSRLFPLICHPSSAARTQPGGWEWERDNNREGRKEGGEDGRKGR